MRALLSVAPGDAASLVVGTLADPVAAPGEVVVAIKACAINFPDTLIIEDKYQFRPERPFAPGSEFAGVVESIGTGVTRWRPGDRVIGMALHGGLAEKVALAEADLVALPDGRAFEEGAALIFTYGTMIHALIDRAQIAPGDRMLVLGAAGGIGMAAVELGKALGATVVGAVSSEEKAALVRAAGADDVVVYPAGPLDRDQARALGQSFKAAAGGAGFDIVCDAVGGDYAEPAMRTMDWEGRYLVIGFPAGIPKIPLNLPLLKSCDIRGVFWGAFRQRDPAANAAHVAHLFRLWAEGRIAPRITETFPLDRAAEAIARLGRREALGKLVVSIAH